MENDSCESIWYWNVLLLQVVGCYQSSAAFNSYEDNIHIDVAIIIENSTTNS